MANTKTIGNVGQRGMWLNMNKKLSFVLVFAVILFGIIASMYMMSREKKSNVAKNEQEYVTENTEVSEKITDECTDE